MLPNFSYLCSRQLNYSMAYEKNIHSDFRLYRSRFGDGQSRRYRRSAQQGCIIPQQGIVSSDQSPKCQF